MPWRGKMPWRWWPQVRRTSKWSRVLYKMKMQMQWQRHWWAQLLIDWNIWVWLGTVFWRYVWHCFTLFWTFGMTACFFSPPISERWTKMLESVRWEDVEMDTTRSCSSQASVTSGQLPFAKWWSSDRSWRSDCRLRMIQIDLDGQSDGLLPSCDTASLWNRVGISIHRDTPEWMFKWMGYNGQFYI